MSCAGRTGLAVSQYAALLKPLTLKGVTFRNRIMSTAHTSGAGEDGKPKLRYQLYHEEKAKGGVALTMIGGSTAVAPDTPGADMLHLDASSDDIIPYYQEISARIKKTRRGDIRAACAYGPARQLGQ